MDDSADERVSLPGCTDELEWVMPGSARERDLYAEGLDVAVRGAHPHCEGFACAKIYLRPECSSRLMRNTKLRAGRRG